jgi:NADH:ubiquinone oxidoreductase subunit K
MIGLQHFMLVSAGLFCIGLFIIVSKKNAIQILIGIELMLNAANLNLVAFGRYDRINNGGQMVRPIRHRAGSSNNSGGFGHHPERVPPV